MADCESCKNYDRPTICTTCENGSDFERIVQTNADKIRAMSDEELAELFAKLAWNSEVQTTPLKYLDWLQSETE